MLSRWSLIRLTHKGWFWFCPVYLALGEDECVVEARLPILEPLFTVAHWFESARIFLTTLIDPDYEPTFMFKVTGEIKTNLGRPPLPMPNRPPER